MIDSAALAMANLGTYALAPEFNDNPDKPIYISISEIIDDESYIPDGATAFQVEAAGIQLSVFEAFDLITDLCLAVKDHWSRSA